MVPPSSLVRVDYGTDEQARLSVPASLRPRGPLRKLRFAERLLLTLAHPCFMAVVLCPTWQPNRDRKDCSLAYRGHIIAFPNPKHAELIAVFPRELSELKSLLMVG